MEVDFWHTSHLENISFFAAYLHTPTFLTVQLYLPSLRRHEKHPLNPLAIM